MKTILSDLTNCGLERFTFAGFQFPRHVATMETGPLPRRLAYRKSRCTSNYYHAPAPGSASRGFYLYDNDACGLRWQYADDVSSSIGHTGWFCDEYGDTTIRGIVLRLPRGRGFLAGWTMGVGMASAVDYSPVFDDESDAAACADSMAQNAAEHEREFQARERETDDDETDETDETGEN